MERLVARVVDWGEKIFVVLLVIPFLLAFAMALPDRPYIVLTAISEMLDVGFILTRRSGEVAVAPRAVILALAGTAFPLLVRPGGVVFVPSLAGMILMVCGLGFSVSSKVYLNRSFGLVAANRGVKIGGPYRLVRHPMYLGYIITQSGFLLCNFNALNAIIYAAAWTCQVLRVREEETMLCRDPVYREFAHRVTKRLVPGVF